MLGWFLYFSIAFNFDALISYVEVCPQHNIQEFSVLFNDV